MNLGALVYAARKRRGWTQEELARRAGVSKPSVSRIEAGTRIGKAEIVLRVTDAVELGRDQVVGLINKSPLPAPIDATDEVSEIVAEAQSLIIRLQSLQRRMGRRPRLGPISQEESASGRRPALALVGASG